MTRTEFYENISTFGDLKDFCWDNDCYLLEDVISNDDRDDKIDDEIHESNEGWRVIRDWLNSLETGYDWWECDGYDYVGLDEEDDFDIYMDRVADWAENHGVFEPEEEREGEADEIDEALDSFYDEPIEEEDFSVNELFSDSSTVFGELEKERISFAEAAAEAREQFKAEAEMLEKAEYESFHADFSELILASA